MKKSLIAVAALAAVSAASAQSSLNVYGVADVMLSKDTVRADNPPDAMLRNGGISGSRLGFKGTEDLGGGLKANFLLEQGIDLTSGAAKGFNRQAYVGMSGGFGEVKFGNVYTAYDDISGATNPGFDSQLSVENQLWASTGYTSNPGSNIYYATPNFGGFSGAVSYSLDGSKNEVVAIHAKFENGPIYVGLAYQDDEDYGNAFNTANAAAILAGTVSAKSADKYTRLNGSYDFGSFKLLAGYGKVKNADVTEYSIGADVPVATNLVLSGGYASSKNNATGVRGYGFNLVGAYSLSKRTTVYGGFRNNEKLNDGTFDDSRVGVGIKHTF
jgi:predicted porin